MLEVNKESFLLKYGPKEDERALLLMSTKSDVLKDIELASNAEDLAFHNSTNMNV